MFTTITYTYLLPIICRVVYQSGRNLRLNAQPAYIQTKTAISEYN